MPVHNQFVSINIASVSHLKYVLGKVRFQNLSDQLADLLLPPINLIVPVFLNLGISFGQKSVKGVTLFRIEEPLASVFELRISR